MPSVVIPDRSRLIENGMPRLVGVPVILHDDGHFFHEASSYLRDRSLMRWFAGEGRGKVSLKRPSENTLRNLAGDLTHFFDFCAAVGADWRELGWSTPRGKRSIEGYISAMRARRHKVRGVMRIAERLERFLAYRGSVLGKGYRFLMSPGPMVTGNSGRGAWSPVWLFDDIISPGVALRRLAVFAQAANTHLVSFAASMRPEELNVLTRGCLVRTKPEQGVIRGYRLKDSDAPMGEPRDWPLPALAVEALQRQERLVGALDPEGGGLWSLVGHRAPAKSTPVTHSVSLSFGGLLDGEGVSLDRGEPFNLKRIRASVARLVALSTQGGASVLYDVFGHDRMEMTMGYMRAKGDLAEEIHEIEDRMRRARIATEVTGARPDQLSGGSAPFVRELLELDTSAQSGRVSSPGMDAPNSTRSSGADGGDEGADKLEDGEAGAPQDGVHLTGSEDISIAAEILSSAQLVRPGVLCRAVGRFRGACSDRPSVRDVANCAPGCIHRLETAAAIEERRRTLLWHLEALDTPEVKGNPFQVSFSRSGALTAFGTGQGVEDLMGDDRLREFLAGASASERTSWTPEVQKKIDGREA